MKPGGVPAFARTSRVLAGDRSRFALATFVVGAAGLLGWGLWACFGHWEATGPESRTRTTLSPAAWFLEPGGDAARSRPAR